MLGNPDRRFRLEREITPEEIEKMNWTRGFAVGCVFSSVAIGGAVLFGFAIARMLT